MVKERFASRKDLILAIEHGLEISIDGEEGFVIKDIDDPNGPFILKINETL